VLCWKAVTCLRMTNSTGREELTVAARILLAAKALADTQNDFSAEDLVVRAWELFPDQFGLQGFANKYPDSNRVFTKIMGAESALRKNGWLRKIGEKKYQLTPAGSLKAEQIAGRSSGERLATVDRSLIVTLRRMLTSRAFAKYSAGELVTFSDVCSFWNISPRSTANQFADRTKAASVAIDVALEESSEQTVQLPGGADYQRSDLTMLRQLSEHLMKTFEAEIAVILSRKDERRL
jgi:hypothetical protein